MSPKERIPDTKEKEFKREVKKLTKHFGKKLLSLFMVLAMVLSLFPAALAAEGVDEPALAETEIVEQETPAEDTGEEAGDQAEETGETEDETPVEESGAPFEEAAGDENDDVALYNEDGSVEIAVTADGYTISENGVYHLTAGSTGVITLASDVTTVTLKGNGAAFNTENGAMITDAYEDLYIDASQAPGVSLTLEDMYISNTGGNGCHNSINFSGEGNRLIIQGVVVLDHNQNAAGYAGIHVNTATNLRLEGDGTFYFYKREQGAGIGGNGNASGADGQKQEMNGDITLAMTGKAFVKGTKQGAVIGAGAQAKGEGVPGSITIESGEYNLISNSRGGVLGGSAGSAGASQGTTVYFNGGSTNINVDFSGAAVGGGGYASGNDASGGTAYFNGGSVRVYIDKNAAYNVNWGSVNEDAEIVYGLWDYPITAQKRDGKDQRVYKLRFNTELVDEADEYTVLVDGKAYFTGGKHSYSFVNEALDKDPENSEQIPVDSTPSNWLSSVDKYLYFYVPADTTSITVNGREFKVTADLSKLGTATEHGDGIFAVAAAPESETTYTVTAAAAAGVTLDTGVTEAPAGQVIRVTPTLGAGYRLTNVQYKLDTAEEWTEIQPVDGEYFFTMPEGNVTVSATVDNTPQQDEDGYYQLETLEQLQWFVGKTDANAKLMNDLDASSVTWPPWAAAATPAFLTARATLSPSACWIPQSRSRASSAPWPAAR